ncbi:hypothetical protein AV530_007499 [Patagioenas fasciata monilis]|uniref:Uncharacterized protein n=1 Tax=Patagioenas fasciata monilis TaxID=372326 RepID=A0A1V4JZL3_PATFA|nr:hypothetical protein AV530_007499 [Patagioenas fasciata monilis]
MQTRRRLLPPEVCLVSRIPQMSIKNIIGSRPLGAPEGNQTRRVEPEQHPSDPTVGQETQEFSQASPKERRNCEMLKDQAEHTDSAELAGCAAVIMSRHRVIRFLTYI